MSIMRGLAVLLSCTLLAACVAHGQQVKQTTAGKDSRVFSNHSSHSSSFFRELMQGRVYVSEHASIPGMVRGEIYRPDGRFDACFVHKLLNKYTDSKGKWGIKGHGSHAVRTYHMVGGKLGHTIPFYDSDTGTLRLEAINSNKDARKNVWWQLGSGWVQDSWPRVLADGCPGITPLPGMAINAKQTSQDLAELRRQDPDAPIRNAPGSELTAPGRVGLIASNWGPTTTREEVEAFMDARRGDVMLSPMGHGYVFVEGYRDLGEVWRLAEDDGRLLTYGKLTGETDKAGQEWVVSKIPTLPTFRYPVGYPFPMLPTGHRHAAFQLTDRLIEAGEPVVLPWMPKKWKDFTFLADGKVRARRADGSPDRLSTWTWTEGRLWVQVDGNQEAPGWKDVAKHLGMARPKLWTPTDGQRIGPVASADAAQTPTSGTARCIGDHEGIATWTLDASGAKVWDSSGCRKKAQ